MLNTSLSLSSLVVESGRLLLETTVFFVFRFLSEAIHGWTFMMDKESATGCLDRATYSLRSLGPSRTFPSGRRQSTHGGFAIGNDPKM